MQARATDALPLVSILINNYNYGHFLAEAIDSVLNQTYPNKEVVVVDDGSTDHSREIIAQYGDAIVSVLKPNGGQASAFNAGFAKSLGEIICFLDADDLFVSYKVAAVVKALKNPQESAWCFHPLELVDLTKKPLTALEPSHGNVSTQLCDVRSGMRQGGKGLRQKMPFSLPATSGLCFTRTLLEQILPMPEAEGIALGDTYLQFTAIALAQGFAIDRKLALQRVHASNLYTRNANRKAATARIFCLTAFWMWTKFPFMAEFAHKIFAAGLSNYWHVNQRDSKTEEIVGKYFTALPLKESMKIRLRSLYYYFTTNHVE